MAIAQVAYLLNGLLLCLFSGNHPFLHIMIKFREGVPCGISELADHFLFSVDIVFFNCRDNNQENCRQEKCDGDYSGENEAGEKRHHSF